MGLIIIVFGIIILSNSDIAIYKLAVLLGLAYSSKGVSLILASTYPENKSIYAFVDLILGCILYVFGVFIMLNTETKIYTLGIFAILIAFTLVFHKGMICFERKSFELKYTACISFGIIHGAFAGLFIFSLDKNSHIVTSIIGGYLLVLGVLIIIDMIYNRYNLEQT